MQVDQIFINGNIITVDKEKPRIEAFAVREGKIVATGSNEEITALKTDRTDITDLKGQVVVPGFNDSHLHLLSLGKFREMVDLNQACSQDDLVSSGQSFLKDNPQIQWLLGRGWNHENFINKELPSRYDLDKISKEIPILFTRVCGHLAVANSKALEMAGLAQDIEQPDGGRIDLDKDGVPTGILRENALGLILGIIPKDTIDDYKRLLQKGAREALSFGLTSVQTDDFGGTKTMVDKLTAYSQLLEEGFPLRISFQTRLSSLKEIKTYLEIKENYLFPEHTIEYGPVKLMLDGSLGGRTAALLEPYSDDPETDGVVTMAQEKIDQLMLFTHSQGLQTAAHAIGDKAIKMVLESYRKMLLKKPAEDSRPRIIHAQITSKDLLKEMAELGVVCDIQPIFVGTDLHIVEKRVGERAKTSYAWKTMNEMGIPTAGGSDAPVESCNPLLGIYTAVTRQDLAGYPENGFLPDERLTVEKALELFTLGSAYATKDEKIKGSISPGKLADFVILSDDITAIPAEEIKNSRVLATYISGDRVY